MSGSGNLAPCWLVLAAELDDGGNACSGEVVIWWTTALPAHVDEEARARKKLRAWLPHVCVCFSSSTAMLVYHANASALEGAIELPARAARGEEVARKVVTLGDESVIEQLG